MRAMIPCATVYRVNLPAADELREHLDEMPLKPVGEREYASHGFVEVPWSGDLVAEFDGGYAFAVKSEERVLPAAAIKRELNARSEKFHDEHGYKPGRKLLKEMKENVEFDLLPKALIREAVTVCFYDSREGMLYVPTTSDKRSSTVNALLVRACSAIEFQTVVVDGRVHGITERLASWLKGDPCAFGDFAPAGYVVLSKDTSKVTVKRASLDRSEGALTEASEDGFTVKEIGLSNENVSFILTDRFRLKSIKQEDVTMGDDHHHNASVEILYMREIVGRLLDMIGPAATPVDYDDDL